MLAVKQRLGPSDLAAADLSSLSLRFFSMYFATRDFDCRSQRKAARINKVLHELSLANTANFHR